MVKPCHLQKGMVNILFLTQGKDKASLIFVRITSLARSFSTYLQVLIMFFFQGPSLRFCDFIPKQRIIILQEACFHKEGTPIKFNSCISNSNSMINELVRRSDEYLYSRSQYRILINTTIVASSISIFFSMLTLFAFFYLRSRNSDKASKLSLRCVFIATIMNIVTAIFDIITVLQRGDGAFCRSSTIIKLASKASSASLLAVIGVNLVLVFVINIKGIKNLEWIFYISVFVYVMVTISVPIHEISTSTLEPDGPYECWYYIHFYELFGHSEFLWMWFYGFLFVSILVAFCSSAITLIKLLREYHSVMNRFTSIAATSETPESANLHIKYRKKKQSSLFIKVTARCSLYPLVPFICNIFGFIFQLILANPRANPDFALSTADTALSSLQGFFLTIVFFSDPASIAFFRDCWNRWRNKYLYEFQEIQRYGDGHIRINDREEIEFTVTSDIADTLEPLPDVFQADRHSRSTSSSLTLPTSSFNSYCYPNQRGSLHRHSSVTLPSPVNLNQNANWEPYPIERKDSEISLIIPMRRVSVSPSVYTRMSQHSSSQSNHYQGDSDNHTHILNFDYTPQDLYSENNHSQAGEYQHYFPDPNLPNKILIPYKHPRFAKCVHWFMVNIGIKKPDTRLKESPLFHYSPAPIHPLDI
ncbi:hypothetical protein K501DRAFT_279250 [Backusella circina FSU 941]|nr:hypothetical protein K501DRAFT_279250 [Backusella circina FSU 941]